MDRFHHARKLQSAYMQNREENRMTGRIFSGFGRSSSPLSYPVVLLVGVIALLLAETFNNVFLYIYFFIHVFYAPYLT